MRQTKAKAVARRAVAPSPLLPLAFLAALSALVLSGCNTVSGMGEDISAAGNAIDRSSERTQDNLTGKTTTHTNDYQAGRY